MSIMHKGKIAKNLDFKKPSFMANGTKYIYCFDPEKFGLERSIAYQKLEPIITFSKSFDEIYTTLNKGLGLINNNKVVEGHFTLYDLKLKIAENLQDRVDPILRACCLFIAREDEDLTKFDEKDVQSKIEDWKKEGINYQSFFTLIMNSIPKFMEKYTEILKDSSQRKERGKKRSTKSG